MKCHYPEISANEFVWTYLHNHLNRYNSRWPERHVAAYSSPSCAPVTAKKNVTNACMHVLFAEATDDY